MREVKAQALRANLRPFLRHMLTEHFAQCSMQQMGDRVMGCRRQTTLAIHLSQNQIAQLELSAFHITLVGDGLTQFDGVGDGEDVIAMMQQACIPN